MEFISYSRNPDTQLTVDDQVVQIFDLSDENLDPKTVESFGDEWQHFQDFEPGEIDLIGNDYFDIVPFDKLADSANCLDVGCGSGRWCAYLSDKVGMIEGIDPSEAAFVAAKQMRKFPNVRISKASAGNIPFPDNTFDLVYSLGVLHHIPDTLEAMRKCVQKVKPGGYFLVYLYYALDNRGLVFKLLFFFSNLIRKFVSILPDFFKNLISDILAVLIYLPLVGLAKLLYSLNFEELSNRIPLSYYRKTSWFVIRNDARDRFGTPLEQRFSKGEIKSMMENCGLTEIQFSQNQPYWHAIGIKPPN